MKPSEAPALAGWITASEVASELGVSRQIANKMINRGDFKTLHTIGKRPMYVIKEVEVEKIREARAAAKAAKSGDTETDEEAVG